MKAIQLEKPRSFLRIEIAEPAAPGPGEALVRIHRVGICGTDHGGYRQPGERVRVIGAGPIGLALGAFASLSGATTRVMDSNEQRLEFARENMGVPDTILATGGGDEVKRLQELTGGQLADVVLDATGNHQSMSRALDNCAFAGRLVYVGITQEPVSFPHAPILHRRELTLLASRTALAADFTRIIKLIEDGQIDTRPWITHHADFDGMIAEFPNWLKPETGVIKAVVEV